MATSNHVGPAPAGMATVERAQVTAIEVAGDTEYRVVLEQGDDGRYHEIRRTPLRQTPLAWGTTQNVRSDEKP